MYIVSANHTSSAAIGDCMISVCAVMQLIAPYTGHNTIVIRTCHLYFMRTYRQPHPTGTHMYT